MKYTLTKEMVMPICLVVIVATQIFDYFVNGSFNAIFIAIVCFLTPATIKGLKPKFATTEQFKFLSRVLLVIGIIIMVLVILW